MSRAAETHREEAIHDILRSRHDEAARIAQAVVEQDDIDEAVAARIAAYAQGRADTWSRAQAIIDAVRYQDQE